MTSSVTPVPASDIDNTFKSSSVGKLVLGINDHAQILKSTFTKIS
jgi:hypothetical protein